MTSHSEFALSSGWVSIDGTLTDHREHGPSPLRKPTRPRWVPAFVAAVVFLLGACGGSSDLASIDPSVQAEEFDPQAFEIYVEDSMDGSNVPGLAVVLFDEDGVTYEGAFGNADADETEVTLDMPFQAGSISKSFAALLVVQLAAEGRIDLDAPVVDVLPDFRTRGEAWSGVTVRHVLTHRSGLSTLDGNRQPDTGSGADALARAVENLRSATLRFEPGDSYEYSNANYTIVAALVEAVAGEPFETVMTDRIFDPLGMTNSYVHVPAGGEEPAASGFRQWFGVPGAVQHTSGRVWVGAGGVVASGRDLAIYLQAMANKDPRIIPPDFVDEVFTPYRGPAHSSNGYGLGWMFSEFDGKDVMHHSGLTGGFAAHAAFDPQTRKGGAVLTNSSGLLQADIAGSVLRRGMGAPIGVMKPTLGQHLLVWGVLASALALLLGFIVATRRFAARLNGTERVALVTGFAPPLALFGLAYVLVRVIPQANGLTLTGMRVFFPDLWLCLLASAVIAVLWGVTHLALYVRRAPARHARADEALPLAPIETRTAPLVGSRAAAE